MNSKLIISWVFFLFCFSIYSNAQDGSFWGHPEAQNIRDKDGKKQGVWLETNLQFAMKAKYYIGNYKDGVRNGIWRKYENGKIISMVEYKNGIIDGTSTVFNNKGRLVKKMKFVNGKLNGYSEFYKRGKLIAIYYYENNKLKNYIFYCNSKYSPAKKKTDFIPKFPDWYDSK